MHTQTNTIRPSSSSSSESLSRLRLGYIHKHTHPSIYPSIQSDTPSSHNPQRHATLQQAFPLPEFLSRLGLGHLAPRLLQEGVTLEHIRIMREGDLGRLGVGQVSARARVYEWTVNQARVHTCAQHNPFFTCGWMGSNLT